MTIKLHQFQNHNLSYDCLICDTTKYLPVYKANYRSKMSMAWHEILKSTQQAVTIQINDSFKALKCLHVYVLVEKLIASAICLYTEVKCVF